MRASTVSEGFVPALLAAVLLVSMVHLPLLGTPPLGDEAELGAGTRGDLSAVLLHAETWLPASPGAHRAFGLFLELALLGVLVAGLRAAGQARPLALLLVAAYLVHPARTESVVRLGLRGVPWGELGLALAFLGMLAGRSWWSSLAAGLLAGAGAFALPAAVAFGLPLSVAPEEVPARRRWTVAAGLLAGAGLSLGAARPAAPRADLLTCCDVLAAPWRVGLVQPTPDWPVVAACAALAVLLLLFGRRRGRTAVWWIGAAALAGIAATRLRCSRSDFALLGPGVTPESLLPAVALALAAVGLAAACGAPGRVLALAVVALCAGTGWARGKDFRTETAFFQQAVAVNPAAPELRLLLGRALLATALRSQDAESAAQALQCADLAAHSDPGWPQARELRARVLLVLGRLAEARSECEGLVEASPQDPRFLLLRGDVETAAGDVWEALRWYRAARSATPDPEAQSRYLGALQERYDAIDEALRATQPVAARQQCEALLTVAPEEIHAREVRAHTFAMEGHPELALRAFEEVLEVEPRSVVALRALVNLSEELGDAARAQRYRQELLRVGGPGAFQ